MKIAVLILAAGASSRMRGGDKLLEPVDGEPLLRTLALRALATGATVAVSLPPGAAARAATLKGLAIRIIEVPDAATGMSASLRRGVAALADMDAIIVQPGDMPEIGTADILALIEAFRSDPERPLLRGTAHDGTPGHPVLFPRRLFPEFAALSGDTGAAPILRAHKDQLRLLALPGAHATTDLDSPEDWRNWRNGGT